MSIVLTQRKAQLVLQHVSAKTGVAVEGLVGTSRHQRIVQARWRAMRIFRRLGYSTCQIGKVLNRDHSTVVYGLRRAAA